MKITLQNWEAVKQRIQEIGIRKVEDGSRGVERVIVTKDGQRFKFTKEVFKEFKAAGLLKRGIKIDSHN